MTRTSAAATDLLVGVAAGLGATLAMSLFQSALACALSEDQSSDTAAMRAADAVSEKVSGAPVKSRFKKGADTLFHFLTGAAAGGLYGLVSGVVPAITLGRGMMYGGIIWRPRTRRWSRC